jgi:hypothetical protein
MFEEALRCLLPSPRRRLALEAEHFEAGGVGSAKIGSGV